MKFAQVLLLGALTAGVQAVFLRQDDQQLPAALEDLPEGAGDMMDKLQDASGEDLKDAAERIGEKVGDLDLDEDDLKELKRRVKKAKKEADALAEDDAVAGVVAEAAAAL